MSSQIVPQPYSMELTPQESALLSLFQYGPLTNEYRTAHGRKQAPIFASLVKKGLIADCTRDGLTIRQRAYLKLYRITESGKGKS